MGEDTMTWLDQSLTVAIGLVCVAGLAFAAYAWWLERGGRDD